MRTKFTRVVAGVAALAVASVALISGNADALPPGTAAAGPVALSPATGNSATVFTLTPSPAPASCPGDTATCGYFWSTFMSAASVDPATLTYDSAGPVSQGGAFAQPLFSSGTPVVSQTTAVTSGIVTGVPSFSLGVFPAGFVPAGNYNIGIACTLAGATVKFWTTQITITVNAAGGPSQIDYSLRVAPSAPVLASPLTAGNGTLAGSFSAPVSTPAATGYTVTAVPTAGATVTLPVAAPGAFTLTGLVNGTSYAVSVTTTNAVGTGPASNVVNGSPTDPNARPGVTGLAAVPGTGSVTLTWVAPTGVAPTGYSIGVSPTVAGAPFAAGVVITFPVAGLVAGTLYTFTVTPTHPAPFVGAPAQVQATPFSAAVIIQDVSVTRPAGALVLTQKCGLFGALPAEAASTGFPALTATTASGVGTAPTLTVGGAADPQFPNYPSPATPTYPTHCGIALGTATLVTSGAAAGQYYAANGQINQVTVSDTRDGQNGWTVNGTMSTFTNSTNSAQTFGGNWLGWTPVVTGVSVGQTVTPGAAVLPNNPGLAAATVLASAPNTASLGVAQLDARLKLLIPVTAPSGTYNGTLTFTVA